MRLPWRRRSVWDSIRSGSATYDVTFARLMHDIETVTVRADSAEEAMVKAERYLFANIFPRTVVTGGVHVWPPGSRRDGLTVADAAEARAGRVPDCPRTDLTGAERQR
jgi:hypothetical protein